MRKNKEDTKKYLQNWRKRHPELRKKWNKQHKLKSKYGLTHEEAEFLYFIHHDRCTICQQPETRRRLSIDHNHKTKAVRGLLCSTCNQAL